jgi:hypothetical protein
MWTIPTRYTASTLRQDIRFKYCRYVSSKPGTQPVLIAQPPDNQPGHQYQVLLPCGPSPPGRRTQPPDTEVGHQYQGLQLCTFQTRYRAWSHRLLQITKQDISIEYCSHMGILNVTNNSKLPKKGKAFNLFLLLLRA